ncbi:DUF1565 domain-containing protein [Paenibacillus durus]|uniref:DUF1565 domain-containing protein n=1 Tax=Paenibacillus durus TaxID=44251 RepID=UPI0006937EEC|nr:DUF1565 domain-containing protein [Paenibacillus durus]
MRTTNNLGLRKPEGTDIVDIADLNGNMDTLDSAVKSLQDQTAASVPLTQKGAANGVATLDASAKLPAGQLPATAVTTTSSTLTYYVSTSGSDSNSGLTSSAPFKTIQKAINSLPLVINNDVTISIAAGTYNEDVSIYGIIGKGQLSLLGVDASTFVKSVTSVRSHYVYIFGLTATTTSGVAFYSAGTSYTLFSNCRTTAGANDGFNVAFGRAIIYNCVISNVVSAAVSANNSTITVDTCSGTGNGYVLYGDNSSVIYTKGTLHSGAGMYGGPSLSVNPWGDNTTSSRPLVWANRSSIQSISAGVWTRVVNDVVIGNQLNGYNPPTGVFTSPQSGWYRISAQIYLLGAPSNSQYMIRCLQNSSVGYHMDLRIPPFSFDTILNGEVMLYLGFGDTLEIQAYAGSAVNVQPGGDATRLEIIRIA